MELFGKDLNHEIVVVAEIGVNHEGDDEVASNLVRLAAEAGVDAVKFQSYTPERYISTADAERLERVRRFMLNEAAHRRLAREAEELGIVFFSTAVTEDWVPLLAEICPVLKIASGDLTFEPVIRAAAATGRPMILSVGLGVLDEVDQAVAWVREEVGEGALADHLALLHCVTAYPTPIEDVNLLTIPYLADRYGLTVGYSNHVIGPEASMAAVALGAPIVEVHFTDRKEGRTFRDHALSMESADLEYLIPRLRQIRAGLGKPGKFRMPSELVNLDAARKGIVAGRDLTAGTVLARDHLMFARPASGIASGDIDTVLGARLTSDLNRGEPLTRNILAPDEGAD